jgi:hypothetical protein
MEPAASWTGSGSPTGQRLWPSWRRADPPKSSIVSGRRRRATPCAEALFIKRANHTSNAKGAPVAQAAAALVADDPELSTDGAHLKRFMLMAYRARNAEVLGDDQPYAPLHRLSGAPTTTLAHVVTDAEHIMRRAISTVLDEHAAQPTS